ncbi:hypothetical protein [Sorangium sp. So ce1024]|uniref:hypothetical protein n=1 Tax=unclassified Sorangium TaxID=2621164 RepID=UPI003F085F1B
MMLTNTTHKTRSLVLSLTMAAGLAVTAFTSPAAADSLPTLSGWGVRGNASFMGSVSRQADGSLTGHFTIIIHNPGEAPVTCRYLRFRPRTVSGGSWSFDGHGTCWGSFGAFAASNRFAFSDLGSPGAGVDAVDVNYYGAVGVSIPGGFFDDGDIVYTP